MYVQCVPFNRSGNAALNPFWTANAGGRSQTNSHAQAAQPRVGNSGNTQVNQQPQQPNYFSYPQFAGYPTAAGTTAQGTQQATGQSRQQFSPFSQVYPSNAGFNQFSAGPYYG